MQNYIKPHQARENSVLEGKGMKQYDTVILKDGRIAAVVEIFDDECIVDVGSSPEDWETITVKKDDIKEVLQTS